MSKKVALVTGAGKRTGKALAQYFCANGYETVVHYGTSREAAAETVDEIEAAGGRAVAIQADLEDPPSIENLIEKTYKCFGHLDLLVNNASVFWQEHFPDFPIEHLDSAWAINCRAPILLTRAYYQRAKAAGATGAVVNVVDQKVKGNFHYDHFSYTVGKTAIGNLTEMLAISAYPVLRVNALFPGLMLPSDDQTEADFAHASRFSTPLRRIAGPQDIGSAILLMASPAYNSTDFVIDGGQNLIRVEQDVLYTYRAPGDDASKS
jgi:pteridine reductase